jgi:hypothetical protein
MTKMKEVKFVVKGWLSRNFWWFTDTRRLSEYPAKCDICNCDVKLSDYGYMCRKHGDIYFDGESGEPKSKWRFIPKFLFRFIYYVLYGIDIKLGGKPCSK